MVEQAKPIDCGNCSDLSFCVKGKYAVIAQRPVFHCIQHLQSIRHQSEEPPAKSETEKTENRGGYEEFYCRLRGSKQREANRTSS